MPRLAPNTEPEDQHPLFSLMSGYSIIHFQMLEEFPDSACVPCLHWLAFCMVRRPVAILHYDWSTHRESSCPFVFLQLPWGLSACVRNKRHLLHHLKAPFHRGIPSQTAKPYNCYGSVELFLLCRPLWEMCTLFLQVPRHQNLWNTVSFVLASN